MGVETSPRTKIPWVDRVTTTRLASVVGYLKNMGVKKFPYSKAGCLSHQPRNNLVLRANQTGPDWLILRQQNNVLLSSGVKLGKWNCLKGVYHQAKHSRANAESRTTSTGKLESETRKFEVSLLDKPLKPELCTRLDQDTPKWWVTETISENPGSN